MRVEPKNIFLETDFLTKTCIQWWSFEVTLKSVYSKGQGKGGSHNEKVDKTFDFHKSFGKLQNPDDTFQQTHVLRPQTELDGRVRQILFREKCYHKENNCKGFHFSDLKITTKFSQKRWYLFIKRTRVMLLMFNLKNHNKYLLNSFNNSV